MKAFYSTNFVLPLPDGHRFPMAKYQLLHDRIQTELPEIELLEASAAHHHELAVVHGPAYIEAIAVGAVSADMLKEIGFPWSPAMAERARRSVGGTLQAARAAMAEGIAANLAGGTHHAYADRGSGFCVFNDLAVAARSMQAEFNSSQQLKGMPFSTLQVAIIDLDVHQGNGTAKIFDTDRSVFTLSMHGEKNFPFNKEISNLDIGLPDGTEDAAYLIALESALQELENRFNPGFVLYLAGADPFQGDRLGRLRLSLEGLKQRDRIVFEWCFQRKINMAFAMGGGYANNIDETVEIQINTYRTALQYFKKIKGNPYACTN